jgi:hypothetical protein
MTVVVKRSAVKMWLLAMAGIPLLVISLDVLTNRRITNWLREIVFRPEDTQIFEPRDVIFAWAMMLFAGFLVLWGLKELFAPTRVVECRPEGLALKVNGPFRRPTVIPWVNIDDVCGTETVDEGTTVPLLSVRVLDRGDLPDHPWGARWVTSREIALLAEDWPRDPDGVATGIVDYAVEAAREETRTKKIPGIAEEEE